MKKRIITTFLLIFITSTILGCGASSTNISQEISSNVAAPTENTNISLRIWGAEDDAELLNIICDNFKSAHPEATFEFTIEPQSESNCKDALLGDVNNAPDVFAFADDQFSVLCASGILKAIPNNDEIANRNSASSVSASTMNNTLYAYPLTADNGYFLFYNKKYLNENDVASFDSLLSKAESLEKQITMDWSSGWYTYSFFGNTGLTIGLNDDGISNYCTWNDTSSSIKGTDVATAMINIAKSPAFLNGNDSVLSEGAKNDIVIAGISGVWMSSTLEEIWGSDLGATKLPTYTCNGSQVQLSSYAGYKLVGVNSYSPNASWANIFADYLTSEENQNLRFKMRQQGPSNINASKNPEVSANVGIQALIAQSEFSSLQRIGNTYWSPMANFGELMYNQNPNNTDLQELMDSLVKEITASN